MRVLQVNKAYYPHIGGIEIIVQYLAEGMLHEPGINVEVLACGGRGRTITQRVNGVLVRYVAQWGTFSSLPISPSFPLWLGRYSGDILHIHEPFPLADLGVLTLQRKITSRFGKIVVWWHSDIVRQKWMLPLYTPLLRCFLRRVDRVAVATPYHIKSSRFLPGFQDKCKVIPYGIPLKRFEMTQELDERVKKCRGQIGSPMLLFVGRLVYYKGLEYLIQAMRYLPDCKLVIVGSGPLEAETKVLAAELTLGENIIFVPRLSDDDLVMFYHACDVFVLPSTEPSEAFGIVQLEAMACGKPVVSTDLDTGVTFVNRHGETGLTVSPRDAKALAAAVHRLLKDRELHNKLGEYARKRVQKEFSKQLMVERTLQMYHELLTN